MNNKGDEMDTDLSALWQTQPVSKIDVEAVKRNFNNERKKQRFTKRVTLFSAAANAIYDSATSEAVQGPVTPPHQAGSDKQEQSSLVKAVDEQGAEAPTAGRFSEVEQLAEVYGGLCAAPFHFKHFDELIADMGATKRKRNPIAENMSPPNAQA